MKEFMRKLMMGILITAIVLGSVASLWIYFYHQQKNPDNLPNLQAMKGYLTEKGEVYASEKIAGYDKDTLEMVWGEPVGELFGMDGRVWKVDDTCSVTIYFDGETATNAKLVLHNGEETNLTRDPFHLDGTAQLKLEQRKQAVLDALNNLDYQDGYHDIFPEYEIIFDENNIFGISEIEMQVWKDFKVAELPEELYDEMYDIGLLEYYQMEDGKWKYHGRIYDQMIEMVGRTPNAVRDSRFVVLTNNPQITFEEVSKSLISSSTSDHLNAEETVVVEIGVE